jgi:hypothetical protein
MSMDADEDMPALPAEAQIGRAKNAVRAALLQRRGMAAMPWRPVHADARCCARGRKPQRMLIPTLAKESHVRRCPHRDGVYFRIWENESWECHQALSRPQRSRSCQLRYCAALAARQPRKPHQPPLFPVSRSRRRSKKRGRHRGGSGRQTPVQRSGEGRPPGRRLKQREGRRRLRGVLSWRSLPGSRERPTAATMVANRASDAARTLGLDAANRRDTTQSSRQPAKTHSLTGTTCNA